MSGRRKKIDRRGDGPNEVDVNRVVKENKDLKAENAGLRLMVREMRSKMERLEKLLRQERQSNKVKKLEKENAELKKKVEIFNAGGGISDDDGDRKRKEDDAERQRLQQEQDEAIIVSLVQEFLATFGGLSRYTLCDDMWHRKHPTAAYHYLGFPTWTDCKQHLAKHFPDLFQCLDDAPIDIEKRNAVVNREQRPRIKFVQRKGEGSFTNRWYRRKLVLLGDGNSTINKTELEKCLCIRMADRIGLSRDRTAIIYGIDTSTIRRRWIRTYGPHWCIDNDHSERQAKTYKSSPMMGISAKRKYKQLNQQAMPEKRKPPPPPTQQQQQPQGQAQQQQGKTDGAGANSNAGGDDNNRGGAANQQGGGPTGEMLLRIATAAAAAAAPANDHHGQKQCGRDNNAGDDEDDDEEEKDFEYEDEDDDDEDGGGGGNYIWYHSK